METKWEKSIRRAAVVVYLTNLLPMRIWLLYDVSDDKARIDFFPLPTGDICG